MRLLNITNGKASEELSLTSNCDNHPQVNTLLDKGILSLDGPMQNEMEQVQEQEDVRDQVICMIFDLPVSTQFYQDFSCAIASTLAMHGRMYPTSSHVCFYSNVFGRERKILIPYESICEIKKTTTMMFQHAIRLTTFDKDEYTFTSFWGNNRDSCCDLITKTRDRVLAELRLIARKSSVPRTLALQMSRNTESPNPSSLSSQDSSDAANISKENEDEEGKKLEEAALCVGEDSNSNAAKEKKSTEVHEPTSPIIPHRLRVVSDVDSIAPKDISMTPIREEAFSLSVDTFMQLFFLDNAPFGLDKFNEQLGSTEITVNLWKTPVGDDGSFGRTRSLQFRIPIEAPIGPKSSQVDVLQCLKKNARGVCVIESSTRLVDIPYGDYFSVEDRWTIVPQPSNSNACKIFIEMKVVFGKSTFWKNTIETRAIKDNRLKWEKWVGMAKAFLNSRKLDQDVCILERSPTSDFSSDKAIVQDATKMDQRSVQHRSKPNYWHRNSVGAVMPSEGAQVAHVKVFPWVLVLLLVLVILRLQMTLSSIQRTLLVSTERISDLYTKINDLQTRSCLAT
ncbi:Uncharacterized conserved protein, contains GRAM domain [Plasmopara halstedii]|uniref:Uncharacterized conserved protein, contains GRAM domain n=1 Tax=Plasmopara halstedii TaxID=4781 RepID=A0A0N7L7J9_PLAHL|nr:Uncharacterized conserved protein, contains GRAM domain [Plasmopara halstedii]CEG47283.1 Uncharacterized conserved protein, contains GRAM domain [Plasmopara halstedii]|eukprot:XP_024583652.1 Uncharacterized conserved protein, contains GRAM domain [Plasmopara halstedii]